MAALRRAPEEARRHRIEAADQFTIGHEGPQPGPGVGGARREGGPGLDGVQAECNVQLFGLHVLRVRGVFVHR